MTDEVRDHWYWRPGWRQGRSFYTWHVVFPYAPALSTLRDKYEPLLASMPELTPVPARWLHLTLQGVGFADKVSRAELDSLVSAARRRLRSVEPFGVTIGPAIVDVESLQLPVRPSHQVRQVWMALRDAITEVCGADSIPAFPDLDPHISIGYWNRPAPAAPLRERVHQFSAGSTQIYLNEVSLLDLNRDHQCYQWSSHATIGLGHLAGGANV